MKLKLLCAGIMAICFASLVADCEIKIEEGLVNFPWNVNEQGATGVDFDGFMEVVQCVDDNNDDEQLRNVNEFLQQHNMLFIVSKSCLFCIKKDCLVKKIPSPMSHIKWLLPNMNLDGIKSQLNFENRNWDLNLNIKISEHLNVKIPEYIRLIVINKLSVQMKQRDVEKNFQEIQEKLKKVSAALDEIKIEHEEEDYSHLQQPPSWGEWVTSKFKFW